MERKNVPLLSDDWEKEPDFGFDDYSTLLATIIQDKNLDTPFTIAVYGNWGSGKTTLMKAIERKFLKPNSTSRIADQELVGVKSIWFSAWEYEKLETPLWAVFLNRVIMEIEEKIMKPNNKQNKKIVALGKGLVLLACDVLMSKTIGLKTSDLDKIRDKVWKDIDNIKSLGKQLQDYVDEALKYDTEIGRIVIFVDDLDRCLPEQSIHVFESIKLFLNCKNCVFVIGIDREQIRKIFRKKFESTDETRSISYVEKFVQLEFDLPPKTKDEIVKFILKKAPSNLKEKSELIKLVSEFIEPNPRKIKRLLNSVLFLEKLFVIKKEELHRLFGPSAEIDISLALIWVFLKTYFTRFSNIVTSEPSNLNKAISTVKDEKIEKKAIGDFEFDERLVKFLNRLEPKYDETQIEYVIHLSRLTPVIVSSENPIIIENLNDSIRMQSVRIQTKLDNIAVDETIKPELRRELSDYRERLGDIDSMLEDYWSEFHVMTKRDAEGTIPPSTYNIKFQEIVKGMESLMDEVSTLNSTISDIEIKLKRNLKKKRKKIVSDVAEAS